MSDKHKIANYNVEFNKLAALTALGDAPLRHAYYKGLPDRIKDALVNVLKAKNLDELRIAAQQVDIWYWERHSKKNHNQPDVMCAIPVLEEEVGVCRRRPLLSERGFSVAGDCS